MEEIKIKAIVLSNSDYREKDKIVNLFSLEIGLVSIIIKNCRTSSYKLKFAYSPFSFAEFELLKKGEMLTLKNATIIENFFVLCEDYNKYIVSNIILETLLKSNKLYESNHLLFLNTLKILNKLAFEDSNIKVLLLKFLLGTLKVNGFKLNFKYCNSCNNNYINKIFLNLSTGEFECGSCNSNYSVVLEREIFDLLKKISYTEIEELDKIESNERIIKNALELMILNIENRFNIKLNSKKIL